jgi:PBSX family phage portal protein
MALANHTAVFVDEQSDDMVEIDLDVIKSDIATVLDKKDPFEKVKIDSVPKPLRKRLNEIKKKYEGQGGAATKYIDPELVHGYSLYGVVEPPYDLAALGQLYDESGILHSVVDSRVMNTVGLGFDWEPTLKARKQIERATGKETSLSRLRDSHQKERDVLSEAFDQFNEEETFIETMIRVWLDFLVIGNGYLEIGRTKSGKIGYLGHVPGTLVRVRRDRDGFVQQANQHAIFFRNFGKQDQIDPINGDSDANEMIHFKMYTPNNNYYGIPPSVSALAALIGDKFAKEFNIDYFENKAIPRYAIILKGVKLSGKSKQELIQYFKNEVKGKNHGTLVIPLPASLNDKDVDVRFEKLETEIQDASFDKYRKSNRDEIISVYRVPPTKVGVFENANLAVSRDADKTFKSQVVGPDQVIAEKKVNRIVKEFSELFKLKFNQLDVLDEDLNSRIMDRYARIQVMDPNEIREAIGLPPREGGGQVLPFPIKTGYQSGQPWPNLPAVEGTAGKEEGGAPPGNTNSGKAPKSGQDNGKNKSNADATGTNAERGQQQDRGKTRERSQ